MKFEPGTLAVGVAILIFYLRIMQIRGRKRKERAHEQAARVRERMKSGGKNKGDKRPPMSDQQPNWEPGNWWLLGVGAVASLVGLALFTVTAAPWIAYRPYWWAITAVGILVFTFGIK